MRSLILAPVLSIFLLSCTTADSGVQHDANSTSIIHEDSGDGEECRFRTSPVVIKRGPHALLQYWEENKRPVFSKSALPAITALIELRNAVIQSVDTNPVSLLRTQRQLVDGGDARNVDLALEHQAGSIRTLNCLDALLLGTQAERSALQGKPMYTNPTEFMSYVLVRDGRLKVYYYTTDQMGVRGLSIFNELLDRDLSEGWQAVSNIHNHNFFPDFENAFGGVAPSATDIEYFRNAARRFDLAGASITNGFHTMEIHQDEFDEFSSVQD